MKQRMVVLVRERFLLKGEKRFVIFGNTSEAKAPKRRGSPEKRKKNVDSWIVNTCYWFENKCTVTVPVTTLTFFSLVNATS